MDQVGIILFVLNVYEANSFAFQGIELRQVCGDSVLHSWIFNSILLLHVSFGMHKCLEWVHRLLIEL
jgi:hypothetical protein